MRTSESICSLAHSSPERERQREGGEVGGGLTNLSSVSPSSSSNVCISPFLSLSCSPTSFLSLTDTVEAQGRNVAWLNISDSHFLPVVFSLIGGSKAAMSQARPRLCDPTGFYHSFLILSCIFKTLAHFLIHMWDKDNIREKMEREGFGWKMVEKKSYLCAVVLLLERVENVVTVYKCESIDVCFGWGGMCEREEISDLLADATL